MKPHWTSTDVVNQRACYWTNEEVDQQQTPPSHIHNASAIDVGQKYFQNCDYA